jgi:ubiquitin C-terminal hydrolase
LLDQLHEELNRVPVKEYVTHPLDDVVLEKKRKEKLSDKDISDYFEDLEMMRNRSVIRDLLAGTHLSSFKCQNCNNRFVKTQVFITLPVYTLGNTLVDCLRRMNKSK